MLLFLLFVYGWMANLVSKLMIVHVSHFVMKLMLLTCASCCHACILVRFGLAEFSIGTIKSGLHAPFQTIQETIHQYDWFFSLFLELFDMIKEWSQWYWIRVHAQVFLDQTIHSCAIPAWYIAVQTKVSLRAATTATCSDQPFRQEEP